MPLPHFGSNWNIYKFYLRKIKIERLLKVLNEKSSI